MYIRFDVASINSAQNIQADFDGMTSPMTDSYLDIAKEE